MNYREEIETKLDQLLSARPHTPHQLLFEAARYSLLSPGKRLRPLLTLATAEAYETPLEKALHPACALEMIHTYSLIHDDLPCMDDDDLRRGQPTLHKVYPEGHAVLTGDFLLTYAFQILSEAPHLSAEQRLQLIQCLSKNSGADGMIGGQVVDLSAPFINGSDADWALLQFVHLHKTAALIKTALEFGGIIAEAPPEDLAHLQAAGTHLGLGFQMVDDILDADQEQTKVTAVSLLGLSQAQDLIQALFASALQALSALSRPAPTLAQIAHELIHRTR